MKRNRLDPIAQYRENVQNVPKYPYFCLIWQLLKITDISACFGCFLGTERSDQADSFSWAISVSRHKFSAELMQNYANSVKPMRPTTYFERSIGSKGLGCGEVKTLYHPEVGCQAALNKKCSYTLFFSYFKVVICNLPLVPKNHKLYRLVYDLLLSMITHLP